MPHDRLGRTRIKCEPYQVDTGCEPSREESDLRESDLRE